MPELPQKGTSEERLNNREERFCLAFVKTADRYESFDIAKYEAKTQDARAAAVSRLLKRPKIKRRIEVLQREYMLAKGVSEQRILGNLAEIAFNKKNHNVDRTRALELLGKKSAMWIDRNLSETLPEQPVMTEEKEAKIKKFLEWEADEARKANIKPVQGTG